MMIHCIIQSEKLLLDFGYHNRTQCYLLKALPIKQPRGKYHINCENVLEREVIFLALHSFQLPFHRSFQEAIQKARTLNIYRF